MADTPEQERTENQGQDLEPGSEANPIHLMDFEQADDPNVTIVMDGEILTGEEDEEEEPTAQDESAEDEPEEESSEEESEEEPVAEATETEGEDAPDAEDEDSDEESPTDVPEAEAVTETPAEGTEDQPEWEPLPFKADGTEFTVEGRKDEDGNIVIAPDEWQRSVQPRLADRGKWQQERESLRRQIAALNPESNPEVVRAREITARFHELLEQGPDAVIEWAENWERNKEVLLAKAEAEAAKAEARQYQEAKRSEETQALEGQLDEGLDQLLEQASQLDEYADLDMGYVKRILQPMKASIYFKAPYDMPEYGLKQGQIGMHVRVVEEVLQAESERVGKLNESKQAAEKAAEAAKRNAAATGKKKVKAPPVEKTTVSATQESTPDIKPAKTKDEWLANLNKLAR